jgi:hypothetical protein
LIDLGGIFDEIEKHGSDMGAGEMLSKIFISFVVTVLSSITIGISSGIYLSYLALICSFIFRKLRYLTESEVLQVVITYLFGILSYVVA